ncbi:ubiquinol-cytochrome c reductase core subunit 1 [Malassezia cuniculi]|uniref:Cytochrome b-c1 complex subunit 2, mitochondrial n=1 Tax=Malassezia cuniculi TaxID=948313 RepID=A0AAF0EZC5_9BASI|nr:ubiquinol-cytochrome c reductase core subunit 1 [Malassezia cuniculi]
MSVTRSAVLRSAVPARLRAGVRGLATGSASIPVAAINESAPVVSLTVAARAGPRFQNGEGVAHALKNFAFKSTNQRSALRIIREAELNGGVLSASLTPEIVLLTANFLKGDEAHFAELLAEVIGDSKLCRFEFNEEVVPSLAADHAELSQNAAAFGFDALYRTAYRGRGVGSSLYANPASPIAVETVREFAKTVYNSGNIAVVGSGISHEALESLVGSAFGAVPAGSAPSAPATKYFGGDLRTALVDAHGHPQPVSHFFVGYEGAPRSKSAVLSVLESLLGGVSSIKWSHGQTPLGALSTQVAGAKAHAFNSSLSDSGIFGLHVTAPHSKAGEAVKASVAALDRIAQGSVASEEVAGAIARAKFAAAAALESSSESAHAVLGAELLDGAVVPVAEKIAALEAVNGSQLSAAAGELLKSKATTVALGNLEQLPYGDEL